MVKIPYKQFAIAIGILVALVAMWWGVSRHYIKVGQDEVQLKWDKDKAARAKAEELAIADRNAKNAQEKEKQDRAKQEIQEKYDAELTEVRNRLAISERMRVGTALCSKRPSAPSKTNGAQSGAPADPGTVLVRDDVERDIRALMIRVEEAFATGRACQAFIRVNGLAEQ